MVDLPVPAGPVNSKFFPVFIFLIKSFSSTYSPNLSSQQDSHLADPGPGSVSTPQSLQVVTTWILERRFWMKPFLCCSHLEINRSWTCVELVLLKSYRPDDGSKAQLWHTKLRFGFIALHFSQVHFILRAFY